MRYIYVIRDKTEGLEKGSLIEWMGIPFTIHNFVEHGSTKSIQCLEVQPTPKGRFLLHIKAIQKKQNCTFKEAMAIHNGNDT